MDYIEFENEFKDHYSKDAIALLYHHFIEYYPKFDKQEILSDWIESNVDEIQERYNFDISCLCHITTVYAIDNKRIIYNVI